MTVSRIAASALVLGVLVAAQGCTITAKTKTRFNEPSICALTDGTTDICGKKPTLETLEWKGGKITVNIDGVGAAVDGGVTVTAVAGQTSVRAVARFSALANPEDKSGADQSIIDAKGTFKMVDSGGAITISCGHGGTHASSQAGESGCERVDVTVPTGTDIQKLDLKVLGGNGGVQFSLANAVISNVEANSGNGGYPNSTIAATLGGTISLVSGNGDIKLTLSPSTWAADIITTQGGDPETLSIPADAKNGETAGGRGTAGTGLKSVRLRADNSISDIILN